MTIITAAEAKTLFEDSGIGVNFYTEKISGKIRELATNGIRVYACYEEKLWSGRESYDHTPATKLQQSIMNKFKSLGFGAQLERDGETYVPRGLADDDGDGPQHQNVCMVFRW